MAYFSNGTEGLMYEEQYCNRCVHRDDENGCPIWNLHFAYVGEKGWQRALDKLIPMEPKVINGIGGLGWWCPREREAPHPGVESPDATRGATRASGGGGVDADDGTRGASS